MHAIDFLPTDRHARLLLDGRRMRRFSRLAPTIIDITPRCAPERARVEAFIQDIYARHYGAEIRVRYPTLMSVRNGAGEILAAAGFRLAGDGPLFLERYTGAPIEDVLTGLTGAPVARADLAEIGNLAASGQGASVFLYAAIAAHLMALGARLAVVTGTDRLHGHFQMMGLAPRAICAADPAAGGPDRWGRYYDTNPRVLYGHLESGMDRLNRQLGAIYQENGVTLFPRLHHAPLVTP